MTDIDLAHAAYAAGFRNEGLRTFLAIEMDECRNVGPDGDSTQETDDTRGRTDLPPGVSPEYSVGPAQINLLAHPECIEFDARLYVGAAFYGRAISKGGTDFSPWSTYQDGSYRDYLARADAAIATAIPEILESIRLLVVRDGDTLSSIAQEVYGDGSKWPDIYEANRALIGENPDLIQAGQQLVIPPEVAA